MTIKKKIEKFLNYIWACKLPILFQSFKAFIITMTIFSLMINYIESQYTAEYIANVFWYQHIAQVSSITLIPNLKNTEIFHTAYIAIAYWCDSEVAYNFIQRLKNREKEARIVHKDDDWWPVEINTHNDGLIDVGPFTTKFPDSYFEKAIDDQDIEEIESYLNDEMKEQLYALFDGEVATDKELEDLLFKNAIENKANITLRHHQKAFMA